MTKQVPAMNPDNDPNILPGAEPPRGERADVAYGEQRRPAEGTGAPDQLHVCFHCAGELVYPLDWSEEGPRHWRIVLRCPECESRREGVFDQARRRTARRRARPRLERAARRSRRMTHANMSEEIEFFVRALDADLITPSDF